ncbi:glycosyltransferase family protein [Methylobacterium oryzihabitans]|nr:glycosyltransferase [Methylobacterium oryzihabitans]
MSIAPEPRQLYIAWARYQRRPEAMKDALNFDLHYIYLERYHGSRIRTILRYVLSSILTFRIVVQADPDIVWYQSPPGLIAHVLVLARLFTSRRFKIVADLHNAALSKRRWRLLPGATYLLNRSDAVVVHNDTLLETVKAQGILSPPVVVLNDLPPPVRTATAQSGGGRPLIVMPASLAKDEPLEIVAEVARLCPDFDFVVTSGRGLRPSDELASAGPSNLSFPPFLPIRDYDALLARATAILAITRFDGIQLSAATEAIAFGKPLVISDTEVLKRLFGRAAIVTENTPEAIAAACACAVSEPDRYASLARALRDDAGRRQRWDAQARRLMSHLQPGLQALSPASPRR